MDVSFISLKLILPAIAGVLKDGGEVVCLIKVHGGPGLVHTLSGNVDQAAHDGGLGFLAALLKAFLRQKYIQSDFLTHGKAAQERARQRRSLEEEAEEPEELLFISTTPWLTYTALVQPAVVPT